MGGVARAIGMQPKTPDLSPPPEVREQQQQALQMQQQALARQEEAIRKDEARTAEAQAADAASRRVRSRAGGRALLLNDELGVVGATQQKLGG